MSLCRSVHLNGRPTIVYLDIENTSSMFTEFQGELLKPNDLHRSAIQSLSAEKKSIPAIFLFKALD